MNGSQQIEIVDALSSSVNDLRQKIDVHCHLLSSLMGQSADGINPGAILDSCNGKGRELKLKEAIREAIEVIEDSRKAFKSKKLEVLRKKLTNVLIDAN